MKIIRDRTPFGDQIGNPYLSSNNERWNFYYMEQYSQFFGRMNWYNYNFLELFFEYAPYKDIFEFRIIILGIGFGISCFKGDFNDSEK